MGNRDKFRVGDYLIKDDESGLTVWASEVKKTWDGFIVRKDYADERQPQTYIYTIPQPTPVYPLNVVALTTAFVCASSYGTVVNGTTVSAKPCAASHLFDLTFA